MKIGSGKRTRAVRHPSALLSAWLLATTLVATHAAAAPMDERAIAVRRAAEAGLGHTEANWLVAIGINRFQDDGVSPLQYAVADAQAIHEFFTSTGFVPTWQAYLLVTDAPSPERRPTRNTILEAIQYAAKQAGPDSTIVISFSGHGFVDSQKSSYLFPEDGKVTLLEDTGVAVTRINEMLAASKARRKVVFVDACRNMPRTGARGDEAARTDVFLNDWKKVGEGQVTVAACKSGEVSREAPQLGHGIFTHFLLEGLRGKAPADARGLITLPRLHEYVAAAVPQWCSENLKPAQQPWLWGEMGAPIALAARDLEPAPIVPTPLPEVITNSIGMKLRLIPAGSFLMGSDESGGDSNAMPGHRVTITKPFYIAVYEVTQEQYEKVMRTTPSHFKGPNLPVENVSWNDAVEFCRKLSQIERVEYRLPTEAEWEYACRAGSTTYFCFGDDVDRFGDYAWYTANSGGKTHPGGQKQPNDWGLYDMHGNVEEWCADWYSERYLPGAQVDPTGPAMGMYRVLRGGSLTDLPWHCRSAARGADRTGFRFADLGFRVVRTQK